MKLGFAGRADVPERAKVARRLADHVRDRADLVATPRLSQELGVPAYEIEEMDEAGVEILVTVGGDGTILYALQRTRLPVCGINMGEMGFMTSAEPDDGAEALDRLLEGEYEVEERTRLASSLAGKDLPPATNEVVVKSPRPSKVLSLKVACGDRTIVDLVADGLIVSTATGSTGYGLSAGGPLVHPAVDCFVIVPLAPFSVNSRSYVVPTGEPFTAHLTEEGKHGVLSVDGQTEREVRPGQELRFSKSGTPARLVRFDRNFYDRVRDRFL